MRRVEGSSGPKNQKKFYFSRVKQCLFCREKVKLIDYKNYKTLEKFTLEMGKIMPARITGTCSYHQKQLTKAIKRARHMGFLKFVESR